MTPKDVPVGHFRRQQQEKLTQKLGDDEFIDFSSQMSRLEQLKMSTSYAIEVLKAETVSPLEISSEYDGGVSVLLESLIPSKLTSEDTNKIEMAGQMIVDLSSKAERVTLTNYRLLFFRVMQWVNKIRKWVHRRCNAGNVINNFYRTMLLKAKLRKSVRMVENFYAHFVEKRRQRQAAQVKEHAVATAKRQSRIKTANKLKKSPPKKGKGRKASLSPKKTPNTVKK